MTDRTTSTSHDDVTHDDSTCSSEIYVGDHAVDAQAAAHAGTGFIDMVSGTTSFDAWALAGKMAVRRHVGAVAGLGRAMQAGRSVDCQRN